MLRLSPPLAPARALLPHPPSSSPPSAGATSLDGGLLRCQLPGGRRTHRSLAAAPPPPAGDYSASAASWRAEAMAPTVRAGDEEAAAAAEMDRFVDVGNMLADAAGEVIRKYFRKSFEIIDKDDLSPVTIADRAAEESMVSIILENFPSHAIYGEENGWRCREESADYVWVLDPIDGTKSFITGKPLFGTLIALLHKGKPIVGIIDQPVLGERWIGMKGRTTTLNGVEVCTRPCNNLSQAYLYTTSPHLFSGDAEEAFVRVRNKVKVPLYGCDCYAYALLASGFVDLVIESGLKVHLFLPSSLMKENVRSLSAALFGTSFNFHFHWSINSSSDNIQLLPPCHSYFLFPAMQPYDFLSLIPVIEGAGGSITDWKGQNLYWEASPDSSATSFNVVAAGDPRLHQKALDVLQWH